MYPSESFSAEYGDEEHCPQNNGGPHQPDWNSVSVDSDGDAFYVDVACRYCGRSGCLGQLQRLTDGINW